MQRFGILQQAISEMILSRLRGYYARSTIPWSVVPISRQFGFDRGQPVDRYYIEKFIGDWKKDIRGRVLEIGDREYTQKFGGDCVANSDVLHAKPGNPAATLVGDLATGEGIPSAAFDCIIATQTLLCIFDFRASIATIRKALKPNGVLLATLPGISQISRYDMVRWGDYWRFTDASARRLFENEFGASNVTVTTYGNVLAACAFLHGMASHELRRAELEQYDPDYQVTICVRAVRTENN